MTCTAQSNVDIWLISLLADREVVLSAEEVSRAGKFRFEADRARWMRAHSALRSILAGFSGIPPAEIRFVLGPHGKPALADGGDIEFSLSHAGDWAMIAVARGAPVGIDIERIRPNVNMSALLKRLGEKNVSDDHEAQFGAWTRREAMTKALGGALMETPRGDLRVVQLAAPEGYCASLAMVGRDPQVRRLSRESLPEH